MGFVGDDDDVAALGEGFVDIAFFGLELLDGGEDHAAGGHFEQRFEMLPAFGLHRLLAQQLLGGGEGVEELIVQVVAVGDDDDGGVVQGQHDLAGVEDHREGFAAALGVPDHAGFAVAPGLVWRRRAGRRPRGLL